MYIVKQIGTQAVVTVVADDCGDCGCEWFYFWCLLGLTIVDLVLRDDTRIVEYSNN